MSFYSTAQSDKTTLSTLPSAILSRFQSSTYLVLALVLTLFAIAPLFYPGYIQTHNGFVPLWNVSDLRANLGHWRWLPHLATSFDPLRSDGLWPYYLAAVLPFEPIVAVKVVLGLGWLLGSTGMFLWLKSRLGRPGALIAALVYTYLPHQIATVYVRGAWGEAFFWGLLPWAILAVTESAKLRDSEPTHRKPFAFSFLTTFLWLILGLSQLGLTLWAFIFAALLLLFIRGHQAIWSILPAFVGGALAAALSLTIFLSSPFASSSPRLVQFSDHFLYPFQLFSAYWGFGPSRAGWNDGLSFQLGLAAVGLTVLSIILWQQRKSGMDRRLIFFTGAAIFFALLQFNFSEPFWNIPLSPYDTLASTLTYPWQLLGLTGFCLAVLAGATLQLDEQLTRLPFFGSIIILVVLSSYSYLSPQFVQVDAEMRGGPQAELGAGQLTLLSHNFSVLISDNTAGLERSQTTIPLAVHGPLKVGNVLSLNVTWQPLQVFNEDWKVFVHLVDAQGKVLAQFDGQPLEGTYPTSQWIPGELIEDVYPLLLPVDAPPGPYQVFIGLYHEATGARLPVPDDPEGRVVLSVE